MLKKIFSLFFMLALVIFFVGSRAAAGLVEELENEALIDYQIGEISLKVPESFQLEEWSVYPSWRKDGRASLVELIFKDPQKGEEEFKEAWFSSLSQLYVPRDPNFDGLRSLEHEDLHPVLGRESHLVSNFHVNPGSDEKFNPSRHTVDVYVKYQGGYIVISNFKLLTELKNAQVNWEEIRRKNKDLVIEQSKAFLANYQWLGTEPASDQPGLGFKTRFGLIKLEKGSSNPDFEVKFISHKYSARVLLGAVGEVRKTEYLHKWSPAIELFTKNLEELRQYGRHPEEFSPKLTLSTSALAGRPGLEYRSHEVSVSHQGGPAPSLFHHLSIDWFELGPKYHEKAAPLFAGVGSSGYLPDDRAAEHETIINKLWQTVTESLKDNSAPPQ